MQVQTDQRVLGDQAAGDPRRWLALLVLLIGAFLPILDFNVVNLALPAIRQNLNASSSEIEFIISAYAGTYAVFLITGGRLGDLFGRKRMFMLGVTGFTLTSLLCGFAWSPSVLIVGRILQGLTATAMAPQVLASIRVLFPTAEQAIALALYAATFGLANICGQVLGGVLISTHPFGFAWQSIFLVNLPIGLVALVGSSLVLRDSRAEHAQRLDLGGVALLSLTLALLVYPLVEGREAGWPAWMIALLALCPIALLAFVRFEARLSARGGDPLVALSLFRDGAFVAGLVMALVFYTQSSFYLTFAVYLQNGLHRSPMEAGMATLPFALGYFVSSLFSSPLIQRLGIRALTLGFFFEILGYGLVLLAVTQVLPSDLKIGLVGAGIGFGIVMPSVIKAVLGGVDQRHAGLASGMVISTLQIGAALGVAIIGGVFYRALGNDRTVGAYTDAFALALGCNIALITLAALISAWLAAHQSSAARGSPASKPL